MMETRFGGTPPDRHDATDRLADLDLLIVGGGIVGSGIARDAALRGLRVGLVEQYDFASGTSSRSSRLLHGGLRYLAQGRVGLVREASLEKRTITRIAPHLSAALPFIFPTYRAGLTDDWAPWKLRVGVKIYDMLCGGRNLGNSETLTTDEVLALLPGINSARLAGGVRYFDGLTNDARLVMDTLRSASRAGAVLINYCRLNQAVADGDSWRCLLMDTEANRSWEVQPRCVVNATGAWAQSIPNSAVQLRLTKGVHLVIDRARLPVPTAVVMREDARILFAIPWGDRVILGTTDTDFQGPPESVETNDDDVRYILRIVNENFPSAHLSNVDIISTWAGLRPLIADPHGNPSDISRSHQIQMPHAGWWDVSGGKLTTYRLMAEQTIDRIARYLGRRFKDCMTARSTLLPAALSDEVSGILPPPSSKRVVEHYCRSEWALHLDDVMIRRTSWHYYRRDRARLAGQISQWMATALNWSEDTRARELKVYLDSIGVSREDVPPPRVVQHLS